MWARPQELGKLFYNHEMTKEITVPLAVALLLKVDLLKCSHAFGHKAIVGPRGMYRDLRVHHNSIKGTS
jgi:hypothetical protein